MMSYKETLFFIGKCLTISHKEHNFNIVRKQIKSNQVDWNNVVKVATSHYVFPALYCNLERKNLIQFLPPDLVDYMKHITNLNRERNFQIIEQAKEINELLLTNNITPIFLKGTGNLLEGLYDDVAERMVGDIDILVDQRNYMIAFEILKTKGYYNTKKLYNDHRHLPRLVHTNKIGAIEIHKEILRNPKSRYFNYDQIKSTLLIKGKFTLLSRVNKIKLTVFSNFINDYAYQLKDINLRVAYDFYLLGNTGYDIITINENKFKKELNAGIEVFSFILASPKNISHQSTKKSKRFLKTSIYKLNESKISKLYTLSNKILVNNTIRIKIITKAFYKRDYLKYVVKKITSKNWIKSKLKLGFKASS